MRDKDFLQTRSQHSIDPSGTPLQRSGPDTAASPRLPAIDRIELNIAGQKVTTRQAAMRILGRMLNFVEEQLLNHVAMMVDDRRMMKEDLERALTSWATSRGSKSVRYFMAIIDKSLEARKTEAGMRARAEARKHEEIKDTDKAKVFHDGCDADLFLDFLKKNGVPCRHGVDPGSKAYLVYADNVQELFKTYERACSERSEGTAP
jgi:hypothetical protein